MRWYVLGTIVGLVASAAFLLPSAVAGTEARGTRGDPHPRGRMIALRESEGWRLRVDGSIPNATSLVMAENQFNDRPAAGRQFFIIKLTVRYTGRGSSSLFEGATFKALARSNVAYDYEDDCGVIPAEIDDFKKVYTGGTLRGNVCFSVKKTDVRSLLLLVEPGFSFNETETFFRVR